MQSWRSGCHRVDAWENMLSDMFVLPFVFGVNLEPVGCPSSFGPGMDTSNRNPALVTRPFSFKKGSWALPYFHHACSASLSKKVSLPLVSWFWLNTYLGCRKHTNLSRSVSGLKTFSIPALRLQPHALHLFSALGKSTMKSVTSDLLDQRKRFLIVSDNETCILLAYMW
jgi:hypothetical protein